MWHFNLPEHTENHRALEKSENTAWDSAPVFMFVHILDTYPGL